MEPWASTASHTLAHPGAGANLGRSIDVFVNLNSATAATAAVTGWSFLSTGRRAEDAGAGKADRKSVAEASKPAVATAGRQSIQTSSRLLMVQAQGTVHRVGWEPVEVTLTALPASREEPCLERLIHVR